MLIVFQLQTVAVMTTAVTTGAAVADGRQLNLPPRARINMLEYAVFQKLVWGM
jgi:hypothetical protein